MYLFHKYLIGQALLVSFAENSLNPELFVVSSGHRLTRNASSWPAGNKSSCRQKSNFTVAEPSPRCGFAIWFSFVFTPISIGQHLIRGRVLLRASRSEADVRASGRASE